MSHLASGYSDPRAATVLQGKVARESAGAGAGPLAQLVTDARLTGALLLSILQRPVDWSALPPTGPEAVTAAELQLMCARADVRSALYAITALESLSSDPRPRLSHRAPTGNGVRPGVGLTTGAASMGASFTLPAAPRFAVGESMARHW